MYDRRSHKYTGPACSAPLRVDKVMIVIRDNGEIWAAARRKKDAAKGLKGQRSTYRARLAKVNAKDSTGTAALIDAVSKNSIRAMVSLIVHGVDGC